MNTTETSKAIHKSSIIILLFLLGISFSLSAQKNKVIKPGNLKIFGNVRSEEKNIPGAKMVVYKENERISEFICNSSGKFEIKLDLNQVYNIYVSKESYVTKILTITTAVPDSSELQYEYEYKFNVVLLDVFPGSQDAAVFKKPAVKILYNQKYQDFDYDQIYNTQIQNELKVYEESLKQNVEVRNQQKIDSLIQAKIVSDSLNKIRAKQSIVDKAKNDSLARLRTTTEYKQQIALQDSMDRVAQQRREDQERAKLDSTMRNRKDTSIAGIQNPKTKKDSMTRKGGDISQKKTDANKGKQTPTIPKFEDKVYPEGITEETYKEKGRVLLRHVVKKSGVQYSYIKISYDWGGMFYFKDELSMSPSTYTQELQQAKDYFKKK